METEHHFCLVLENVDGGELYDYVEKLHGSLSAGETVDEMLVKRLFLQLVDVMIWLHGKNIVHRDLKLESKCLVSSVTLSSFDIKCVCFAGYRYLDYNAFWPGYTCFETV
jgi:serine/threonine protein kinase